MIVIVNLEVWSHTKTFTLKKGNLKKKKKKPQYTYYGFIQKHHCQDQDKPIYIYKAQTKGNCYILLHD